MGRIEGWNGRKRRYSCSRMRRTRTVAPPNTNTNTSDAQTDGVYTRSVGQVMSRPVETVAPTTSLRTAAATMIDHLIHHLPVVDDEGAVVGLVSSLDFAAELARTR